jgi:hypothetical protein
VARLRLPLSVALATVAAGLVVACVVITPLDDHVASGDAQASAEDGHATGDGGETSDSTVPTDATVLLDGGGMADAADGGPGSAPGLVFIATANPHNGDFSGSVAIADTTCQTSAAMIKGVSTARASTFKAWIASGVLTGFDRIKGNGPWNLPSGKPAFANRAALAAGPSNPIDERPDASAVSPTARWWTGTYADGGLGLTCTSWTSSAGTINGVVGGPVTGGGWTGVGASPCVNTFAFVCFEDP